jgi:hypothetical protein
MAREQAAMWSENLLTYVRPVPFRPFRVVMNGGRAYDVRHSETIRVGRDVAVYFRADPPDAPFETWETFALQLVEHVEHSAQPTPAHGAKTGV